LRLTISYISYDDVSNIVELTSNENPEVGEEILSSGEEEVMQ
jgi:hypothetical protein